MEIEKNELLRYLGWKGQEVDEALQTKLDDAAKRCLAIAEPRSVVMRFPLHGGCMLGDTGIALAGDDIKRHLAGCSEVYLLAFVFVVFFFFVVLGFFFFFFWGGFSSRPPRGAGALAAFGQEHSGSPFVRHRRLLRRRELCRRYLRGLGKELRTAADRALFLRIRRFPPRSAKRPVQNFKNGHAHRAVLR